MSDLENISSSFKQKINSVNSKEELQNLKTDFFGRMVKLHYNLKV